jgi:hypothetical protein
MLASTSKIVNADPATTGCEAPMIGGSVNRKKIAIKMALSIQRDVFNNRKTRQGRSLAEADVAVAPIGISAGTAASLVTDMREFYRKRSGDLGPASQPASLRLRAIS